ncbi:MAG TPA: hypothetical protein VE631_09010 [Alphaproteobacteria bacterium]|nr:hypothetical protein [Alphaproteobacteria bacterium]
MASDTHRFLLKGFALLPAVGLAVALAQSAPAPASAASGGDCAAADGAKFICDATNVEDLIAVPDTTWVIGSDLPSAAAPQGYLHLFDTQHNSVTRVKPSEIAIKPDTSRFPDCPGAPDMSVFAPHGVDLQKRGNGMWTLFVVNHGGREAVEMFDVDASQGTPQFAWVGCAVAPAHFWPDAVAVLPDGGMVVTSLWDPKDPKRVDKLTKGEPVGALDEWHASKGWSTVPGTEGMSGPNGVIATPDGKAVYLALWSGHEVVRISRGGGSPEVKRVKTDMLTDNLRWAPDGSIFVGGQTTTVEKVLDCFESKQVNCDVPWRIDRMDPKTLKSRMLIKPGVYGKLGAGTGAIEVGNELWVSTFRADRIGRFALQSM